MKSIIGLKIFQVGQTMRDINNLRMRQNEQDDRANESKQRGSVERRWKHRYPEGLEVIQKDFET
jgi:hypothetical protein